MNRPRRSCAKTSKAAAANSAELTPKKEIVEDDPKETPEKAKSPVFVDLVDDDEDEEEEEQNTPPVLDNEGSCEDQSEESEDVVVEKPEPMTLTQVLLRLAAGGPSTSAKKEGNSDPFPKNFGKSVLKPAQLLKPTLSPANYRTQYLQAASTSLKRPIINLPLLGTGSNVIKYTEARPPIEPAREVQWTNLKRRSLVSYNGGQPGKKFPKMSPPKSGEFNIQDMLSKQPAVKIAVSVGTKMEPPPKKVDAQRESPMTRGTKMEPVAKINVKDMMNKQTAVKVDGSVVTTVEPSPNVETKVEQPFKIHVNTAEFEAKHKEIVGKVLNESSNHAVLLGTMTMNTLNMLQAQGSGQYNRFSSELFALMTKYNVQ